MHINIHYFGQPFQAGPAALPEGKSGMITDCNPPPVPAFKCQSVVSLQSVYNKRVEAIAVRCTHVKPSLSAFGICFQSVHVCSWQMHIREKRGCLSTCGYGVRLKFTSTRQGWFAPHALHSHRSTADSEQAAAHVPPGAAFLFVLWSVMMSILLGCFGPGVR
jgi:hypothetical protein